MIFTLSVDLIKELFLALVKLSDFFCFGQFFRGNIDILLFELIVKFLGQRLNGKSDLLAEIITRVLAIRPSDKLFDWDNFTWLRLWIFRNSWANCFT